jgi:hypothetical protein
MLMEKTGVSVKKLQPAAIKLLIITVGILNFPDNQKHYMLT